MLFLTPYQAARLDPDGDLRVTAVRFHANFMCVETHHEVGCNGVLFNDPYGVPAVALDESTEREVGDLVSRMRDELAVTGLAHGEMLLSSLKILLVRATRLKREQQGSAGGTGGRQPPELPELRGLVEAHYRRLHAPADYAGLLHATPKALGRLVKQHPSKTLTEVVTLSFLVTPPECWVPDRGGPENGFPILSGAGRLVVKDVIMAGAALVAMADSARAYLRRQAGRTPVLSRPVAAIAT